jgi:hypothetical protein
MPKNDRVGAQQHDAVRRFIPKRSETEASAAMLTQMVLAEIKTMRWPWLRRAWDPSSLRKSLTAQCSTNKAETGA